MKHASSILFIMLVAVSVSFAQAVKPRDSKAIDADKAIALAVLAESEKMLGPDGKGFDTLVAAVNKADPRFVKGSVYLTVGGFDGTMYAHPVPALQGRKFPLDLPDADGKPMQMVSTARDKGRGEIEYRFNDSALKKVVRKWSIVVRVPGRDAYLSISVNLEE